MAAAAETAASSSYECEELEQAPRTLLTLGARKTLVCRMHHLLTLRAMGALKPGTMFNVAKARGGAGAGHRFLRGVFLMKDGRTVVPNFSTTPRLVHSPAFVSMVMDDRDLCVMPAVNGKLLRLVVDDDGTGHVLTNRWSTHSRCSHRFAQAIAERTKLRLSVLASQLSRGYVFFFMLSREDVPALLYVGATTVLRLDPGGAPRLEGHSVFLPPWKWKPPALQGVENIPSLSRLTASSSSSSPGGGHHHRHHPRTTAAVAAWLTGRVDLETCRYADAYNGVFVFNQETLSAVRVVDPLTLILAPLLEGRERDPLAFARKVAHRLWEVDPANARQPSCPWGLYVMALRAAVACLTNTFPEAFAFG